MAAAEKTVSGSATGLRRDAIGLREVLFQSITDMAPPRLSRPPSRPGPASLGFLVAWGYVLVGWLIPPLVLLQLGFTTAATINSEFHGYPASLWWPWSLAGAVIVLAAGYYGVRASARLGTILGVSEIAVFLVLGVFLLVHAGGHNTAQVFTTIANANAGVNVSSRTAYAMERIGAFPRFLAIVSPRHRAPVNSVLVAFVITVAVTLGLGLGYGPTTAFAMVATGLVIVLVAIYILMNAACIGFFTRRGMAGFNWLSHLVIPLLGIAAFVPAWLTAAGIKVFSFVTPLAPPLSYMGPGVAGFMILGVIYMIILYRTNPGRVADVGLVHLDAVEKEIA